MSVPAANSELEQKHGLLVLPQSGKNIAVLNQEGSVLQGKRMKLYLADLQKITNHKHQNSKAVRRRRTETDKYQIQNFNEQKLMIIAYINSIQLVIC